MGVTISIEPGLTADDSKIVATGEDIQPIGGGGLEAWGIDDDVVKRAVWAWTKSINQQRQILMWDVADDPDGFARFPQVGVDGRAIEQSALPPRVVMKPTHAEILEITSQPEIVDKQIFDARSESEPTDFHAAISDSVTNSVETNWSSSVSIGVSTTVEVEVGTDIIDAKAKRSLTISMDTSYGRGGSKASSTSLGVDTQIREELKPGELAVAALSVSRGTLTAAVDFATILTGCIRLVFANKHHKHPFWVTPAGGGAGYPALSICVPILDLLAFADARFRNATVKSRQIEKTGFFADGRAAVYRIPDTRPQTIDHVVLPNGDAVKVVYRNPDAGVGAYGYAQDREVYARVRDSFKASEPREGIAMAKPYFVVNDRAPRTGAQSVLGVITAGGHVRAPIEFFSEDAADDVAKKLNDDSDGGWYADEHPWPDKPGIGPAVFRAAVDLGDDG